MKVFIASLFSILLVFGNYSYAQKNVTVFAGVKPIDYRGSSIQLFYRDESPAPDNFYTNIDLDSKTAFNLGASINNYSKTITTYWDATVNLYLGKYFAVEGGASIGYPLFITGDKNIALVPLITGGAGYYSKTLGTLENHTTWIQVNDTRFQDYANVDLSLSGLYGFVKPTIAFMFEVNPQTQVMLSCGYLINVNINTEVNFKGPDQGGKEVTASEKLDVPNLAFFIDNNKTNDSPFKLNGFEVRIGVNFGLGR